MSLKKAYEAYFKVGAAVPATAFESEALMENMRMQYNSITCENDMKPECILDEAANLAEPEKYSLHPAVTFEHVRKYAEFARENGIGLRGHTLVWHSQTPSWFFRKEYSIEENAPLADRETMLARMENYIKIVLEYVQETWPGTVYAWDVVNEAIDGDKMRESLWTKTVGEDFVLQAFRFARKYASPEVSLFYNDYDTFFPAKREAICELILKPLMEEGLVDGMGMQSHLLMPTDLKEYQVSLERFGALGLQIQMTELDIHNPDPSEASMEALAEKYRILFEMYRDAKMRGTANVTAVIFWGLQDSTSWLSGFRKERSYPLLFDDDLQPKKAYEAVMAAAKITP